jgi:excisionase family DNA binding protein
MMIMYTNSENSSAYVGTSYAAKMLNLSVGTVQKLVTDGRLEAYLTEGGHRRISYESVLQYSQKKNIPIGVAGIKSTRPLGAVSICVLFTEKGITPQLAEIVKDGTFQVVSDPMKLIRKTGEDTHIFIDARIEWMNWLHMERSSDDVHYVVYNSGVLSGATHKHLASIASLIDADISIEMLRGYRLGLHAFGTSPETSASAHMVKQ